jgi:class 3 adenylate cyclase
MASTRRLAAIFAADVAGYSRLMGADEEGTHERLKAHRRELVAPKIGEHSGRVVKNTGDGMLAEFPSVVDAVRCAAELQRTMTDREAGMPEDRRIRFRIGINLGDVIVEDADIFGDGVNVAARPEALAEPGGICISRMVRDQIRDKLPYACEDLGEQSLKNIARPLRVYPLRAEAVVEGLKRQIVEIWAGLAEDRLGRTLKKSASHRPPQARYDLGVATTRKTRGQRWNSTQPAPVTASAGQSRSTSAMSLARCTFSIWRKATRESRII